MGLIDFVKRITRREYGDGETGQDRTIAAIMSRVANSDSARASRTNMGQYLGRYADQAWIYSCINIIQTKAAGVPLKVYRRVGKEDEEQIDHPIKVLLDGANPFMSGYDLRESLHGFKELVGNAYWLLDMFIDGKPTEIYALNPSRIRIIADKKHNITGYAYELKPGIVDQVFAPEEILHFKKWNPLDDFYGLAPICAARDSSDMMMFSDQYNKAFFKNGAEPGGILTSEQSIDDDEKKRIASAWKKLHQGVRKSHRVAILDGGLKFDRMGATHQEMAFGDLKRMTREDVLTVFNMPPIMVGVFDEANYSNAREQRQIFWKDCIIPRLRKVESVLNERFVKQWDASLFLKHDLSGVEDLAEDAGEKARTDSYNVNAGILTANEIRRTKNLPDVPWGDTWWAPMGLSPVNNVTGELPDTPEPAPAPEPPPPPAKNKATPEPLTPAPDQNKMRREAQWIKYKNLVERQERRWAPVLRRLFNEQEREVIGNVRDSGWQKILNQNKLEKMKRVKQSLDVIIFDRVKARTVFRHDGTRLMTETIQASAKKEIDDFDLGIDFNLEDHNVQSWIHSKAFKFSDEVNATTEDSLRSNLEEAIANGETLSQVEERIANVFDIARGSRTAMIARTEVISASNEGAMASYKQSGVVEASEWVTSRDNRVRDEHQIDGETVELGAVFSNGLEYPGDPHGEPGNVINCRCTIAPVTKKADE